MISFTIKVDGVKTATVGNLQNVVKQVNYTVTGTDSGQTFALPIKAVLEDPVPESFINFESLTEPKVIEWVEALPETVGAKNHIALVVERLVTEAGYQETSMPWAPPPAPMPTPPAP